MSHAEASEPWPNSETCLTEYAATLLSQQAWCWGQDILRPEGNWLVQLGFQRIEPPPEHQDGSSVYLCNLPRERNIVLRGFGIFFGNRQIGGVYLSRFRFDPLFTTQSKLDRLLWSEENLPEMQSPTPLQQSACLSLILDLFEWIHDYEVTIVEQLGMEYRRSTLKAWDNGKRKIIPVEAMTSAWRRLHTGLKVGNQAEKPTFAQAIGSPRFDRN